MWNPIGAEIQGIVRAAISDIVEGLEDEEKLPLAPIELCEHALLYAYLYLSAPAADWYEKSAKCLERAVDGIATAPVQHIRYGLYDGLAGFGWMVQHVSSILLRTDGTDTDSPCEEEEDPLTDLDSRLLNVDYLEATAYQYDLISGPVGIGVYWLERLPRPVAVAGLRGIIESLRDCSQSAPDGRTWFTSPSQVPVTQRESAPDGYYNLGVAHGVPGVIGLLAQVASCGIDKDITELSRSMLEESVSWLLAQKRREPALTKFSDWVVVGRPSLNSGLRWCYGDLGIASVLLLAAKLVDNPSWNLEARNLLTRYMTTEGKGPLGRYVRDAGLCHGAIGIAHLFNRAHHAMHNAESRQAAIDWVRKGLSLRKNGVGAGGFYAWTPESFPYEQPCSRFLAGSLGIALALISIIAPVEPSWDRLLLLSTVPKSSD